MIDPNQLTIDLGDDAPDEPLTDDAQLPLDRYDDEGEPIADPFPEMPNDVPRGFVEDN